MTHRSTKWTLGALAAFLAGSGLALAQADSFDPYAAPSSRQAANFTSSSLFAEGDAAAGASDAPAIDVGCCDSGSCPSWRVAADVMFLDRNPARVRLAQTQVGSTEVLNASAMNFNWASGPRLSLMRHTECYDLELTHFDVTGWSAGADVTAPPAFEFSDAVNTLLSTGGATTVSFLNTSRLFSTEFNVRKAWTPNITALAGFRWVEFYDHLQVYTPGFTYFNFTTSNRLYGAQIGLDASLIKHNCFELRSVLKAGVYGNAAQNFNDQPANNVNIPPLAHTANQVSFLGDLGLNGTYRLSDCWAVRGGYQLLWIDGLALAPNQVPVAHILNPANSTVATTNALFAHGATFGLEATW